MRKVEGTISSGITGLPVINAQVSVLKADTTPAQLYSDNGVTPLAQPVLSDGLGYWSFYIPDGTYTRVIANPDGSNPITFPDEEMYEDARNVFVPVGESAVTLPPAGARANLLAAYDAAGLPTAVPPLAGPTGSPGGPGAGVNAPSGMAGNGTTDDRAIIAAYDVALGTGKEFWLPAGTYRISANLTVTNLVRFMNGAKIKPDAGVTVTFSGGVDVSPFDNCFVVTNASSYVWATSGRVTQYTYGAVANGVTDDSPAFQHLVNNQIYKQSDAVRPEKGTHAWATGVIMNYGDTFRSVDWIGPGQRYGGGAQFGGLCIIYTGYENALEIQGCREMIVSGTEFRGPFGQQFDNNLFGNGSAITLDPEKMENWLPAAANPLALSRYKMCSAIHVDPRSGAKATAAAYANSTAYRFGTSVTRGGKLYVQYAYPGANNPDPVSAASSGPSGTSTTTPEADGTCRWFYAGADTTSIVYTDTVNPPVSGVSTQYSRPASSHTIIRDCGINGFGAAVAVKGCTADTNADFVFLDNCIVTQNVFSFTWGHSQGRLNSAINCIFGQAHTHFTNGIVGRQGGNSHLYAANCQTGNCYQMVDMGANSGGATLESCYGEVCNRIGNLTSPGPSGGALTIKGATDFAFDHVDWFRVPKSIITVTGALLTIADHADFNLMNCPLVIEADPKMCNLVVEMPNPLWMGNVGDPALTTITPGEAIMKRSTNDVVFLGTAQGPWDGRVRNSWQYVLTGIGRGVINAGSHALSDVTLPIPFCARTASGSGAGNNQAPYPIALGSSGLTITASSITSYSQTGRTGTLTLTGAPTLSNALNQGCDKGGIVYHLETGNLYVVITRVSAVLTLKQLNNWKISDGSAIAPIAGAGTGNWYFFPTGHYIPDIGYELTYTSGSATVTMARADGTTTGSAVQFPANAVKVVDNAADAMTPVLRANSGVSSVVDGTITLVGNARRTTVERAGLWLIPR